MDDLLAHRAEQEAAKPAEAARADDEEVAVPRFETEDVGRLALAEDGA